MINNEYLSALFDFYIGFDGVEKLLLFTKFSIILPG